jgi:flavin reductase (DIM6/NTAB) family NADH-FMN oxidoreductase RutF
MITCACIFAACNQRNTEKSTASQDDDIMKTEQIDYSTKSFDDLFQQSDLKDFNENPITLSGTPSILTSGSPADFNSMAIGWGAFGTMYQKPVNILFIRANRYTLDFIRQQKNYTITYLDNTDTTMLAQVMHFGKTSGRNTDKMGTHNLHSVFTPNNLPAYKEAIMILECELLEITTVAPSDYFFAFGKNFAEDGFKDAGDYHKIVVGEIKNIWRRK